MRSVEQVRRGCLHLIDEALGGLLAERDRSDFALLVAELPDRAFKELGGDQRHDAGVLLADGFAEFRALLHVEPGDNGAQAHQLLLEHPHAVGFAQNRVEGVLFGRVGGELVVVDRGGSRFALGVQPVHAGAERPRTEEGEDGAQVGEAVGGDGLGDLLHPLGFELEQARGLSRTEQRPRGVDTRVAFRVGVGEVARVDDLSGGLKDELDGQVHRVEVPERQDVDFEQTDAAAGDVADVRRIPHRDVLEAHAVGLLPVPAQRDHLTQRLGGDQDPASVDAFPLEGAIELTGEIHDALTVRSESAEDIAELIRVLVG